MQAELRHAELKKLGLDGKIVLIGKKGITYFNRRTGKYDIVGEPLSTMYAGWWHCGVLCALLVAVITARHYSSSSQTLCTPAPGEAEATAHVLSSRQGH